MLLNKTLQEEQLNKTIIKDSVILSFNGVEGYDVYNPSIIFTHNKQNYLFGRVEKRDEWASSYTALFIETSPNVFTLVNEAKTYPLEDPCLSIINGEYIMGGTNVTKDTNNEVISFKADFYKGKDILSLDYFFSGPLNMKDIRLVEINNKIGVFSRPRGEEIQLKYQVESLVGFAMIDNLSLLSEEVITNAKPITKMFALNEWGGVNQAYYLGNNLIGLMAHRCYSEGITSVYTNYAYVFDYHNHTIIKNELLMSRENYPPGPTKPAHTDLSKVCFTGGMYQVNNVHYLITGLNDCEVGVVPINNPFSEYE